MSPTARTLASLRKQGMVAAVVEKWNPHAKVRQDLFGIGDVLYLDSANGITLAQVTTTANAAAREAKVKASPLLRAWLEHGGKFVVLAWGKFGPRGKRKLWAHTTRWITLKDLALPPFDSPTGRALREEP